MVRHESCSGCGRPMIGPELTPRQRDILRWLSSGADNSTIARHLRISERAVKAHISNLLAALAVFLLVPQPAKGGQGDQQHDGGRESHGEAAALVLLEGLGVGPRCFQFRCLQPFLH